MSEGRPGAWRQARAIGPLPAMATVVVPAALCLIYGLDVGWDLPGVTAAAPVVFGGALIALGLRLMRQTISLFAGRGEGTLAPWDPTMKLVVEGPYLRVRNPMISGVFTVLIGEAALLGAPSVLAWAVAFALVNSIYMPLVEEPGLLRRFGEDYLTYKRNVPRWIPRRTPWISTLGLVLAAALFAYLQTPAIAGHAEAPAAGAVVAHSLSQSPSEVRSYWTPERMREAAPLDLPQAGAAVATPSASPTPYSQLPDQETDPALDTAYPQRVHGILFVSFGSQNGGCSATVVTSFSRNVVLTAGHCVVMPSVEGGAGPLWATNVMFVPGYRNGARPLGSFVGTKLRAPFPWIIEGGDFSADVGAINLAPIASGQIQDVLGSRGVSFNRAADSYRKNKTRFQIFGYPAEPAAFYDGERLIVCNSPFVGFQSIFGSPIAACNMKEGSSGGGWVLKGGILNSVVSHSRCPITVINCPTTAGTYFGDGAFKLWRAAGGPLPKGRRKQLKRCKLVEGKTERLRCRSRAQTFNPVVRP